MKKYTLLFTLIVLLLHNSFHVLAQQWQWGVRGGGASDMTGVYSDERVYDMVTDPNGNVYAASVYAASTSAWLGHTPLGSYSNPVYHENIALITSYSCNGTLRWKKIINGDASCYVQSVRTDTLGHVYVMGYVNEVSGGATNPVRVHFDADTTLPYDLYKRIFIVQYDTLGNYKWLRMPEADTTTIATYSRAAVYDMAVDNSGNLNVIAFLNAGSLTGTGFTVPANGLYVLKYNPQGTLLAAIQPAFNFSVTSVPFVGYPNVAFESFRLGKTRSGKWIISGAQSPYVPMTGFTVNGQVVNHCSFVACFNSQWQYIWHYTANADASRIRGHAVTDAVNNIYLTGLTDNGEQLFGETIVSSAVGGIPFVAKLDSNGNKQWLSYASDNDVLSGNCNAVTGANDIALTTGGEAVVTGGCGGLKWGNLKIPGVCNMGYNIFVARINGATGAPTGLDTTKRYLNGSFAPGGNFGTALAAGKNSNVFIGGQMTYSHFAGSDTMEYIGGNMDFFIAKYGYPCNCITPAAAFTQSISGKTISVTYNGSLSNVDSVVWTFGDGQSVTKTGTAIAAAFNHTYASSGAYTVCATVYSSCGSAQACHNIQVTGAGIATTGLPEGMRLYPNPATDHIVIEGAQQATITLTTITGQYIMTAQVGSLRQVIPLSNVPAGSYLVCILQRDGRKNNVLFVKQ